MIRFRKRRNGRVRTDVVIKRFTQSEQDDILRDALRREREVFQLTAGQRKTLRTGS